MLGGVEEAIIRLENHDDDRKRIIRRLRLMQKEIGTLLERLERGG